MNTKTDDIPQMRPGMTETEVFATCRVWLRLEIVQKLREHRLFRLSPRAYLQKQRALHCSIGTQVEIDLILLEALQQEELEHQNAV